MASNGNSPLHKPKADTSAFSAQMAFPARMAFKAQKGRLKIQVILSATQFARNVLAAFAKTDLTKSNVLSFCDPNMVLDQQKDRTRVAF